MADWQPSEGHLFFVQGDRLGTPQLATDHNGATDWQATYVPYGATNTLVTSGPGGSVTLNTRLLGQYFDHEDGLHYNGLRDYIPNLGRYLESDPIGLAGGLNPYRYASANPERYTDRRGLDEFSNWGPGTTDESSEVIQEAYDRIAALAQEKAESEQLYNQMLGLQLNQEAEIYDFAASGMYYVDEYPVGYAFSAIALCLKATSQYISPQPPQQQLEDIAADAILEHYGIPGPLQPIIKLFLNPELHRVLARY